MVRARNLERIRFYAEVPISDHALCTQALVPNAIFSVIADCFS